MENLDRLCRTSGCDVGCSCTSSNENFQWMSTDLSCRESSGKENVDRTDPGKKLVSVEELASLLQAFSAKACPVSDSMDCKYEVKCSAEISRAESCPLICSLQQQPKRNDDVLVLDIRSQSVYSMGHVKDSMHLVVPSLLLNRPSFSVSKLYPFIKGDGRDKERFKNRQNTEICVIIDSLDPLSSPDSVASPVAEILYSKLVEENLVGKVCIFTESFSSFLDKYPNLCDKSQNSSGSFIPKFSIAASKSISTPRCSGSGITEIFHHLPDLQQSFSLSFPKNIVSIYPSSNPIQVIPQLYIGDESCASNRDKLQEHSITHILNVAKECKNHFQLENFTYKKIDLQDSCDQDLTEAIEQSVLFIREAMSQGPDKRVLVHCRAGKSRDLKKVYGYLNGLFPSDRNLSPNLNFLGQLLSHEKEKQ